MTKSLSGPVPLILALASIALGGLAPLAKAAESPEGKTGTAAVEAALNMTRTSGAATVIVITSRDDAPSLRAWEAFNRGPWARSNRGLVQMVNLPSEDEPALIRTLGVTRFPTVLVYIRTEKGIARAAAFSDCATGAAIAERLASLAIGLPAAGKDDPATTPASYHGEQVHASQQGSQGWPHVHQGYPPTQTPPPQQPTLGMVPTLSQPVMSSASVLQMPSQNLLIQQAPPQIFMAPQQAPVVYVPQPAASAPAMMAMPPAAPVAAMPAPNLFLGAPTVAAAPAAMPVAAAPAAPALAVAASPPTVATLTNQSLSLPSSGSRSRVRVRGPGILAASLARLGEKMVQLGRTRIQTIQETTLEAPAVQSPAPGVTTISTTSAAPVAPPPSAVVVPVRQPPIVQVPEQPEVPCKGPCSHHHHQHQRPTPSGQNP